MMGYRLSGNLVLSPQTSGADVHTPFLTVYDNRGLLKVRQPLPLGMTLGVGYIAPKLWSLPTQLALQRFLL
jgi:hypothetical protein